MKFRIIFPALLVLLALTINSQTRDDSQNKKSDASLSEHPNWGIGVRLGDPSGITIKKYMSRTALELSIGRSHLYSNRSRYDRGFDDWYYDKNYGYKEFQYLGYKRSAPIGVQLHYLFHKPLTTRDASVGNLDWYLGFGGQFRTQRYTYDFRYKREGSPDWYYSKGESVLDIDLGVDGVIGLEYMFKKVPLSIFGDVTLFMEVVDQPFLFWFQGGLGVRYNF
jgi:hypothetical protein